MNRGRIHVQIVTEQAGLNAMNAREKVRWTAKYVQFAMVRVIWNALTAMG